MPYCPNCNTEYREGFTECADCRVPLTAAMAETLSPGMEDWLPVYTGRGAEASAVEENLSSYGFRVVRASVEQPGSLAVGMVGTDVAALYTLAVPASEAESRAADLQRAIAEMTGAEPGDPEALAEAEQDYDVRGCPSCGRYFHDNYVTCPGTGEALVPAVEVFAEGQLAPDRVIVGNGAPDVAEALAARLRTAGATPRTETPVGWSTTVVDVPWEELTAHTEAVEAVLHSS